MRENVFSPREDLILKVLKNRKRSITQIVDLINDVTPVECNNNVIANSVRRINEKCEHHKLHWFLNGYGGGRAGRVIWKDKR